MNYILFYNCLKMTFQYCSDIHLELLQESNNNKLLRFIEQRINPSADYLILAGDIGQAHRPNYKFLLSWCSSNFKKTFIVAGNHEYYTTNRHCYTMSEVDQQLKEVCDQFSNVKFLQKKRYEFIDNDVKYIILGGNAVSPERQYKFWLKLTHLPIQKYIRWINYFSKKYYAYPKGYCYSNDYTGIYWKKVQVPKICKNCQFRVMESVGGVCYSAEKKNGELVGYCVYAFDSNTCPRFEEKEAENRN